MLKFNPFTGTLDIVNPSAGGSGSPGGSTTQVQYNSSGSFAGDANMTWDSANGRLRIGGDGTNTGDVMIQDGFIGLRDVGNGVYYGISTNLPSPSVAGVPSSTVGGYYKGLGIGGSTSGTGAPMFGILSSSQAGNGYGTVALTIYDDNKFVTYAHTIDDGNGNMGLGNSNPTSRLDVSGAITERGIAAPSVSPSGSGRLYYDSTLNHFYYSENGGAYQQLGTGSGGGSGTADDPAYHLTDRASSTVTYDGTNIVSSSPSNPSWIIRKIVLTGNNLDERTVYTSTGTWNGRAGLTYTTSLAYSY